MTGRVSLLGVGIDAVTQEEALERIRGFLAGSDQRHVMTPNSEMLVRAYSDVHVRSVLNRSALNLPDGVGLLFGAWWTGQQLRERVTGVDTVTALLQEIGSEHPVFLLGGKEGVAEAAVSTLKRHNPSLRIAGTYPGSPRDAEAREIVARVNASRPRLLLVAYGAPAQDLWIAKHLSSMPSVRVAMGVGGTLDFLSGSARRAPHFLQSLGFEWLWRVIHEPWRWRRIVNAVVVFPWLVLLHGREVPKSQSHTVR